MSDPEQVIYCGLYCRLCGQHSRIPELSRRLREAMDKEGYKHWGLGLSGFREFWVFLESLCSSNEKMNCRKVSCGPASCAIRKCALAKKIEVCIFCDDYPCSRILDLAERYPTLLADGKRLKSIGIENWVKEQEERRKTGFAYVDIRCFPNKIMG